MKYNTKDLLDLSLVIMVSGFIGARLFHILYENPSYYQEDLFRIFTFWNGGFVFYGGVLGVLISSSLFIKYKNLNFLEWADFFAPIFALGYAIGRMGCFFNGCCYGKICHLPWAVNFPSHQTHFTSYVSRHPTQIYASIIELFILFILLLTEKARLSNKSEKTKSSLLALWISPKGQIFFLWGTLHGINRLIMEYFREDYRGAEIWGLSISSCLSLLIIFTSSHFLFHRGRKHFISTNLLS